VVSQSNLKQIVLGLLNYHDTHGRFPPAVVQGKDGRLLYSWRVLMLPYLEEDSLYQEFHRDEPWDSPHNLPLLTRMPRIFAAPRDEGQKIQPGNTFYQVFVGPGTAFENPRGASSRKIFRRARQTRS